MKKIYTYFLVVSLVAVYGIIGTIDADDQRTEAAHKTETIQTARTEHKRLMNQSNAFIYPLAQV